MIQRCLTSYLLQPVILCLALWITGCSPSDTSKKFYSFNGPTMGTWYNVKVQGLPQGLSPDGVKAEIDSVLNDINQKMSTYIDNSEVTLFNRAPVNKPFAVSAETLKVLKISQQVYQQSNGAFDITVGPLVNLWGFGPGFKEDAIPTEKQIQTLLETVDASAITLNSDSLVKSKAVAIDLSAVAKGYATDQVANRLQALGISRYMVEVGGEIRVGEPKVSGGKWKIAIEQPISYERAIQKILSVERVAVATSGDYRNYFEKEGKRFSHTIDPRTGMPVQHGLASVTVIHESCAYADAYATALTVLGPVEGLKLAKRLNLAVYMLVKTASGFEVLQTEAFSQYVDNSEI